MINMRTLTGALGILPVASSCLESLAEAAPMPPEAGRGSPAR
jgi:hypothetical protein